MTEGTQDVNDPVVPPDNDGVTWNEVRPGVAWDTPGGDFLPPVLSSVDTPDIGSATPFLANPFAITFESTADFRAAAQSSLHAGGPLQLLLFTPSREAELPPLDPAIEYLYRFASDDNATAAFRPYLTVDYSSVPEPASGLLLLFGLVCLRLSKRHVGVVLRNANL